MNIVFKHIELYGFLSLGHVSLDLDSKGFVLVQGNNNTSEGVKSNGSGKSSIFDGIVWILTGNTIRGSSEVKNMYLPTAELTSSGTYGKLEFSIDNHEFIVTRSKDHEELGSGLSIIIDGEDYSGNGLRKSERILNEYLQSLDSWVIGSVIVLGQGLPQKFTSLSPVSRKDLLEKLSKSSDFIDSLKAKLDIRKATLTTKRSELSNKISVCSGSISSYNYMIDQLTTRDSSNSESISAELSQIESQITQYQLEITRLNKSQSSLTEEYDSIKSEIESYKSTWDKLLTTYQMIDHEVRQLNQLTGVCPSCGRPYDNIESTKAMIATKQEQLAVLTNKIEFLQSKVNEITSTKLKDVSDKIQNNNLKVNSTNSEISKLSNNKSSLLAKLESAKSVESQLNDLKVKLMESTSEKNNLEIELSSIDKSLYNVDYLIKESGKEFRGYLLDDVIMYLDTKVKSYSEYLFDNSCIEVKRSSSKIWVGYEGRSYESLSSGERQRVDLAIQFSLRDMMIDTSGFSCNLIVLDESFDGLDAIGCERLIKLINEDFSDLNSVYIITHHSDISISSDSILNVDKQFPGISSITEST